MGTVITNVELTDAGTDKFNRWFAAVAAPGVDLQAVSLDLLNGLANSAALGEDYTYELGSQYTQTGRPEVLSLDRADVVVSAEVDDDE